MKIADLGLARYTTCYDEEVSNNIGTESYKAPEIKITPMPFKDDMYALGLILHFILTGKLPPNHEIQEYSAYDLPSFYSNSFQKLMTSWISQLLNHRAEQRPSVDEVLRFPEIIEAERDYLVGLIEEANRK